MTEADHRDTGMPPWIPVLAILLCIGGGGFIVWWFFGEDRDVIVEPVPEAPRSLMDAHRRYLDLARRGDLDTARELLNTHKDLTRSRDPDAGGATLLHTIAWDGNVDAARLLIDAGANLEATDDRYDGTPLSWAVVAGRPEMVELLLRRKATASPGMGALVVDGINGEFDFAPGTRDDYLRIHKALLGQGIESDRVAELSFIAAVRGQADLELAKAPGVRDVEGDRPDDTAIPQGMHAFAPAKWVEEGVELHVEFHNAGLVTEVIHAPPVRIEAEVKVDQHNIRLYFGRGLVILGSEVSPQQLAFTDPATGRREARAGNGAITPGQWHTIAWIIEPDHIELTVDGKRRLRREGDYADVRGRVGIGTAWESTMTLRRLEVTPRDPPTTEPATRGD